MKFEQLLTLFQKTHQVLQKRASHSIDISLVSRNWLFGWYIIEFEKNGLERAVYGKKILKKLAEKLKIKGCSERSLALYCKFYKTYFDILQTNSAKTYVSDKPFTNKGLDIENISQLLTEMSLTMTLDSTNTLQTLSAKLICRFHLGWSHYVALLTITNPDERKFYEIEASQNSWGTRELERQISSSLFDRLALSRDKAGIKALSEKGLIIEKSTDIIKDPLILEFLELEEKRSYSEHELETAIIDRLEHFLLELGKGYLFEARQKRFTFENDHFYVDLVFYNRLLRCYVLIDIKREKLTHQDLGQMQMYVNYFDRYVKTEDELPTIGILLCHRKNDAVVEVTLPKDSNIFASKYQLYLPTKEEFIQQLEEATDNEYIKNARKAEVKFVN